MTAEIAIANNSAVALAADSAVTVGLGKTYIGAVKLFALSKAEPVGIMIHGNANLLNTPWETIIKEYRKALGDKSFPKISDYRDDFVRHIERCAYFTKGEQDIYTGHVAESVFLEVKAEMMDTVRSIIENDGFISDERTASRFESVVVDWHEFLQNSARADRYSEAFEKRLRKESLRIFRDMVKCVFQELPISRLARSRLYDIGTFALTRVASISSNMSGIVIAGFGRSELYPSIHATAFDGVALNKPKCMYQKHKSAELGSTDAVVIPYAQQEMVHTFIEGIDPEILQVQENAFRLMMDDIAQEIDFGNARISEANKDRIRSELAKSAHALLDDVTKALMRDRQRENVSPVLGMVTALPKDELAAMAEALVSLTAFKRKMSDALETVGGPIDVAVISKGDGLVWVKRKHYFPQELNEHFFGNYYREIDHER